MARRRSPASNPVDLAEDVLAGRSEPDARTIIELVHAINPTGREVNDRDRTRRYELKSKLQSFLVRKFGDELVVTAESKGVGTHLRHTPEPRSH